MSSCSFVAGAPENVVNQIKRREEKFGKSPKTDEELSVIHGNCPWVVLRSGVDAPVNDEERRKVYPRTVAQPPVTNDWAKKTVLGGEMQDHSGNDIVRPAGIQTLSENYLKSAYRIDNIQGHRPVTGITEVTVRSKDTWGMIMEAEIKVKCWSKDELNYLDRVYFKPGYAALLEWGHTVYFREDGSRCITPKLMISDEEFFDVIDGKYLDLDQKILDKRKENSNQEALFGYITNFSFSFNKDGSYDCTIKLLSKGSVIEGLKVKNGSQFSVEQEADDQDDDAEFEDISVWHRIYTAFNLFYQSEDESDSIQSISPKNLPTLEDLRTLAPRRSITPEKGRIINGKTAITKANSKRNGTKRGKKNKGTEKQLFDPSLCAELKQDFPVLCLPIKIKGRGKEGKRNCEYYITLRSLLYLVNIFNSERRFQFNLWDDALYVDSTAEEVVSLNPYIAVKPKQGGTADFDPLKGGEFKQVAEAEISQDGSSESSKPKILNIWINFGQFVNEIDHQIDAKVEDYSIFEALSSLLGKIQRVFGNINEFQIVTDHRLSDNFYSIIDAKCIDTADSEGRKPPEIQVTGLENTVTNLTIQSEISADTANEMCIAAQAPRTYQDSSESSDEAMIHWGENCQQRWKVPDNTGKPTDESSGDKDNYEDKKKKWLRRLRKRYTNISKTIHANKEQNNLEAQEATAEERFREVQLDGERYIHGIIAADMGDTKKPNLQMGIIPIRAGLTMMGIGNFTIGNVFRLKSGVILDKYRDWGHIVTGIEHRITRGRWETTLKTQYYPVYSNNQKTDTKQLLSPSQKAVQQSVFEDVMDGNATDYRVEAIYDTCNLYKAMTEYSGYTWNKSQGHCARYTYAWARAYTKGKEAILKPDKSTWKGYSVPPGIGTGGVGNANSAAYENNIKNLGYTTQTERYGMTPADISWYADQNCHPGDVLIYYRVGSGGQAISGEYGHTQFRTGTGWVSDFPQASSWKNSSYKNDTYPGDYKMVHLKAPRNHPDWDCSAD